MVQITDSEKQNGVVYTPHKLAEFVAAKIVDYFLADIQLSTDDLNGGEIRALDFACGNGELLISLWHAIKQKAGRCVLGEPNEVLCGIDLDRVAVEETRKRIALLGNGDVKAKEFKVEVTNALLPFKEPSVEKGWRKIQNMFGAEKGFDLLIANPPWGADVSLYIDNLAAGEYKLCKGQFDSSDLFVELALKVVKKGGYFAFIIPDSLFNLERTELRRMLIEKTQILYVGRFGERIFRNVNRACAVLICKNCEPKGEIEVECVRWNPHLRRKVLDGQLTFKEAEEKQRHKVEQSRFAANKDWAFDIYSRQDEKAILQRIGGQPRTLRDYLVNYRGVELSKSGKVYKCKACGLWMPYPRAKKPKCPHCKTELNVSAQGYERIISERRIDRYAAIIVGENVTRYYLKPPCWIAPGMPGINYKERSIYEGPKILVRKTGVGILAAIDYENYLTNQVVYIFKNKADNGAIPLEFFLAVLNSRALYYYSVKNTGETEWRSHPYLTQRQILDLPLPDMSLSRNFEIAISIAAKLKNELRQTRTLPDSVDAEIENMVAHLYGFSEEDYARIYNTIEEVENLVPIKALKQVSIADIFPRVAAEVV